MKQTLSLAMIVKNEEAILGRCLDSVKDLVDEIIIIDTGSTDSTIDIAKQYTEDVYFYTWDDNFSDARNYSFSLCTKDFILWLDADDVVKEDEKEKIVNYLSDSSMWDALLCRYVYSHDENDKPSCVLKRHRIVRRHEDVKWNDPIHEYLQFPVTFKTIETDINIDHYKTNENYQRNIGRNLRILEKVCKTSKEPRHLWYYGRELIDNGKIEEGIKVVTKFLKGKKGWDGDIIRAQHVLANVYFQTQNYEKCLDVCFDSIKFNPFYIEPYNIISQVYYNKQDWYRVIKFSTLALQIKKPDSIHTMFPKEYDFTPHDRLCFAYGNIGDYKSAYEHNEKALLANPTGNDLQRCLYNRRFLKEILDRKKDGQGTTKLNLGCGAKRLDGYINVDVVDTPYSDEVFPINKIPYTDKSVSGIYCEHVLEHVSHNEAKEAIKEFGRVIKDGGELMLFLPDLEQCCKKYLNSFNNELINGVPNKDWYKYTIYGYQQDANGVSGDYQYHKTGFSRGEVVDLLEEQGFVIDFCETY